MRRRSLFLVAIMIVSTTASADIFDCGHKAARRVSVPAAGITRVVIVGRAGSLRVAGRSRVADIVATGTACSSDRDDLQDIQLKSESNGSELRIEAVIPETSLFFGFYHARLDFEVVLPSALTVSVTDGSGSAKITDVGPLTVVDGSGELRIRGVHGDVRVRDGSGSLDIEDVSGNLVVQDGSGSIDIRNVQRDVIIDNDGSGSVSVVNVGGNFDVRRKGTGGSITIG